MRIVSLPCLAAGLCLLAVAPLDATAQAVALETITIDARAAAKPFPHFWEQMFGSGRAVLSMRESYREDLRQVKQITDFRYVRFHAILHDEVGVYGEDKQGNRDLQLRLRGPDLRRAAGQWGQAFRRDKLHAQTVGGAPRLPSLLV